QELGWVLLGDGLRVDRSLRFGKAVPIRARADVPGDHVPRLPAERVGQDLVDDVYRNAREERRRPDPGRVLENRLARVLACDLESGHGQEMDFRGNVGGRERELLRVEDDRTARPENGGVDVHRLAVQGVEDVGGVALAVDLPLRRPRVIPDMTAADHRLVGVQSEDMQSHSGETSGDRLADRGDSVAGLTPDADGKLLHGNFEGASVLIDSVKRNVRNA